MNYKKIISLILVISIFLTIIPFNALAATYYETNRSGVPVWSQPTKHSTQVKTLGAEGTLVSVSGSVTNIFGNKWYKVSGGYVYSGNLRKHTNHSASACTLDTTSYEKLDSKNHTVIVKSGEETCVCGKVMVEAKTTKTTQKHEMSNKKCTKCGYEEHVHKASKTVNASSKYEKKDEKYHIFVQYSGDKVCSCGKVVTEGKYTRTELNHFFVGNTCQKCNYEKTLHVHQNHKRVNESLEYKKIDEKTHKKIEYTGDVYCWCEALVSKGKLIEKVENHKFSKDVCTICKYERAHVHEASKTGKSGSPTYEDINSETHTKVSKAPDKYCWCGERYSIGKTTKSAEKHFFVGNKCNACGYEKTIHIHQRHKIVNKSETIESIDEYRHVTKVYTGDAYCWCGELTSEGSYYETTDNHDYSKDTCKECKYTREHVHSFSKNGKSHPTTYENITADTHTKVTRTPDKYCWCNAIISTGKTAETVEKHLFVGNSCSACGYEKNIHVHNDSVLVQIDTEYKPYNEEKHEEIIHTGETRCSCGVLVQADSVVVKKVAHTFEKKVCVKCGYKKEEHIHVASVTKNSTRSFGENETLCHTIVEYSGDEYCKCGVLVKNGRYNYRKESHDFDQNDKCTICGYIRVRTESEKIIEQIVLGEFSGEVSFTGTAGEILVGEIPIIGTVADLRDLIGSIANFESIEDVALNAMGLVPFVGALKYTDEVSTILKETDELVFIAKTMDGSSSTIRVYKKNGDTLTAIVDLSTSNVDEAEKIVKKLNLNGKANSRTLRRNMEKVGKVEPEYANDAHHIVAGTSKKAEESRQILEKFGININHPSNGVFLPSLEDSYDAIYHPSLHTNIYYDKVNSLLREAESEEEVYEILESIAEQLMDGSFFD